MGAIAMCTVWEEEDPIWELRVANWSHMQWIALYWSHMAIWELCGPYGSHIHHMGGGWHHMGAACDKWGPCGSCVCHVGAICTIMEVDGAIWDVMVSYGSHIWESSQNVATQILQGAGPASVDLNRYNVDASRIEQEWMVNGSLMHWMRAKKEAWLIQFEASKQVCMQ
jgi:hypothetical protein